MVKKKSSHDKLVEIVAETFRHLGHHVDTHVEYVGGEMDIVLDTTTYIECKCNWTKTSAHKAYVQIDKAIRSDNTRIKDGLMVTYEGYFDVMMNQYDRYKTTDTETDRWSKKQTF